MPKKPKVSFVFGGWSAGNEILLPVYKKSPGGGESHIKVTRMLIISLCSVNCRFWSHLGFWDGKSLYLPIQVLLCIVHKEVYKTRPDTDHTKISFRGQFKLEPHPHWSPLGVQFEFSDKHCPHFYMRVPRPPWDRKWFILIESPACKHCENVYWDTKSVPVIYLYFHVLAMFFYLHVSN